MRERSPRRPIPARLATGFILLSGLLALHLSALPHRGDAHGVLRQAGLGDTTERARGSSADSLLEALMARMPAELEGVSRSELSLDSESGLTSVSASYGPANDHVSSIEVTVGRGRAAQRYAHESLVGRLRREGRVSETTLAAVPVFKGTSGRHAFVLGFPGQFVVIVSGESASDRATDPALELLERAFRRILDAAVLPLARADDDPEGSEASSSGGFIHSTVVWDGLSFTLNRPASWSAADRAGRPGGPESLVLARSGGDDAADLGAVGGTQTTDTLSVGSSANVILVLSDTPARSGRTSPLSYLGQVRRSGLLGKILVDGRATGEPATRGVDGDSLASFPFRGVGRDGREVRGRVYAVPAGERLLQGLLLAGPDAPAAAVDTAEASLGSVRPTGEP